MKWFARVEDPVFGTDHGSGNHPAGCSVLYGKSSEGYNREKQVSLTRHIDAFCLETQHFPDSPTIRDFPSTVLGPGRNTGRPRFINSV